MTDPRLDGLLDDFAARARPGPWSAPFVHHHDGGQHGGHVVIGVLTHGDETGPLPAALSLMRRLDTGQLHFGGRLTLVVGNPDAARCGQRSLDSDLNRVFVDPPPDDREGRRAAALMPILDQADLFVDLHQTGGTTQEPFYTLPFRAVDWHWARALHAARLWVTRPWGQAFSPGTCCADERVRARGRPGLTVELSQKGLDADTQRLASEIMVRVLRLFDQDALGTRSIADAAAARPDLDFLASAHLEPFGDPLRSLLPGLSNLQPVVQGQLLSPQGLPQGLPQGQPAVRCACSGRLLFPKYPSRDDLGAVIGPLPAELYRVVAPLSAHPSVLWG